VPPQPHPSPISTHGSQRCTPWASPISPLQHGQCFPGWCQQEREDQYTAVLAVTQSEPSSGRALIWVTIWKRESPACNTSVSTQCNKLLSGHTVIYQSRYSLCHPYHHSILLVNNILRLFLHAVVPTNTTYCWELTSTPRDTLSGECVCVWGSYAFTAMNRIDVCAFRAIAHCMLECTPINVRTSSPNILQVLLPSGEHGNLTWLTPSILSTLWRQTASTTMVSSTEHHFSMFHR